MIKQDGINSAGEVEIKSVSTVSRSKTKVSYEYATNNSIGDAIREALHSVFTKSNIDYDYELFMEYIHENIVNLFISNETYFRTETKVLSIFVDDIEKNDDNNYEVCLKYSIKEKFLKNKKLN